MTTAHLNNYSKHILRTSSCKSVPDDRSANPADIYRNRDSGTSSPQPQESKLPPLLSGSKEKKKQCLPSADKRMKPILKVHNFQIEQDDESDSNDSVFSSGSSVDSNLGDTSSNHYSLAHHMEIRDIYLGGSCMIRTKWRKDLVIPMLNQKGIKYYLPKLHESSSALADDPINTDLRSTRFMANNKRNKVNPAGKCANVTNNKHENTSLPLGADEPVAAAAASPSHPCLMPLITNMRNHAETKCPKTLFDPATLDSCRVLLFVITNETRSLAPMTLAAHCIGLGYNVVLCVQMLPDYCIIGNDKVSEKMSPLTNLVIILIYPFDCS